MKMGMNLLSVVCRPQVHKNLNADEFREELRVNNIALDTGEEEWKQVRTNSLVHPHHQSSLSSQSLPVISSCHPSSA